MPLNNCFIPYGTYWSTPFCRWQGKLAGQHSFELAARVGANFLDSRPALRGAIESVVLGVTVQQKQGFYGAPWVAGRMGLEHVTGPTVSQACATGVRAIVTGALEIEIAHASTVLAVTCDRTSNGPHVYYPNPDGPGALGESENPVWDSFMCDPFAGRAMIDTAENVARSENITRAEQEAITLLRVSQYQNAVANDRAFQKRYMLSVDLVRGKKIVGSLAEDEGTHAVTPESLAKMSPVAKDGTVTGGTQTHPADGNAGIVIATRDRARELSANPSIPVQILGYGAARVEKAFMPKAVVPAAERALENAGTKIDQIRAITTHNPFAVNDVFFSRKLGVNPENVNRFGSSLIWGHPQAPTGMRSVIELIEELAAAGGGLGLFSGCAAGDTAMALVIRVG